MGGSTHGCFLPVAVMMAALAPAALAQAPQPEAATGFQPKPPVSAARHMVAAAHPLAARAGLDILRQGGNAIDAAVAVQLALGVVEPQSSGLGGGAFLLHWDAASGRLSSYDGRETAPAAAVPKRFLTADGRPMDFFDAVVGGRSVGVPGVPRLLEEVHRRHGRLPWPRLMDPAIRLAEDGFAVTPRLHALLDGDRHLRRMEAARSHFYRADGSAPAVGDRLVNAPLAATLRLLAAQGSRPFYDGAVALDIVAAVRGAGVAPGDLAAADMAAYRVVERAPVCAPYRAFEVCGMGPPSSGGIAVIQMLKLLERFDLSALPPLSVEAAHLLTEAGRLAYADRDRYVADPDFVAPPALLDPAYLRERAALIRTDATSGTAPAGEPPRRAGHWTPQASTELPSTTQVSIVDDDGNAVSLSSSIENAFGSRLLVRGFLLNNQLTDFSFRPEIDGRPVANRVEGGKRPRSSMAPMIVFEAGRPRLVVGSPGGSQIIGYVAQAIVAVLDWRLDPQAAVALPHVLSRNGPTELEAGTAAEDLAGALGALGHEVRVHPMTSGLHAVAVTASGLAGGADPRREGAAFGD